MRVICHWVVARCQGRYQLSDVAVRLTAKGKPRKRNPAPGEPIVVRLQPHEIARLDKLDGGAG
jgi:hypothetical protein